MTEVFVVTIDRYHFLKKSWVVLGAMRWKILFL